MSALLIKIDERATSRRITLNRPLIHNAFDDALIRELTGALRDLEHEAAACAPCVLTAAGPELLAPAPTCNGCSGCRRPRTDENLRDAEQLAGMLRRLNIFPQPTIALVQGAAYGGGVGLVAACDIAIASEGCQLQPVAR